MISHPSLLISTRSPTARSANRGDVAGRIWESVELVRESARVRPEFGLRDEGSVSAVDSSALFLDAIRRSEKM
jgi:hypothetical protein